MSKDSTQKTPRKLARLPLVCQIRIALPDLNEFLVEHSKNLSERGMFIRTAKPRPVGTIIYLEFRLLDGRELVRVKGEVIWVCREENAEKNLTPGMGVRFLDVDERTQGIIRRALEYYSTKQNPR